MKKTDTVILEETKYIAIVTGIFSIFMQALFLVIGKWNYTVLTGSILSWLGSVLNFYLMGLSIQKALAKQQEETKTIMKFSQTYRMLMLVVITAVGVALPYFSNWTVLIGLFFPRLAILIRPFIKGKEI